MYRVTAWYVTEDPVLGTVTVERRARYETLEEAVELGRVHESHAYCSPAVRGGVTVWEVPPEGAGPEGGPEATAFIVHHHTYRIPPHESDERWAHHTLAVPRKEEA